MQITELEYNAINWPDYAMVPTKFQTEYVYKYWLINIINNKKGNPNNILNY